MAEIIYALCGLVSLLAVGLLMRSWLESRSRLILWCLICFLGLALNNVLLFVDKVIVSDGDLAVVRGLPAALGVLALAYGLIWEKGD
jgi:hypothetical protein